MLLFKGTVRLLFCFLYLTCTPLLASNGPPETGREMHQQIMANLPLVKGKLADYVEQVGQRIVQRANLKDETFTFTVIDDPVINAFALPDGYIYVHRGLLNYLNSEAQLAAVLAHEIGHVTASHHARQRRAHVGSSLMSALLAILTRSAEVGEATAMWGATIVSGYGRDMELEADEVGSRYLYLSGYDPQAMIEVITLLKNHERLEKQRALEAGRKPQFYHGLFATHPRNDQRLREVVSKAGEQPRSADLEQNVAAFRIATEGMIWGENYGNRVLPDNIYLNEQLAFLMYFPDGWKYREQPPLVTARHNEAKASMALSVQPRTGDSPERFIQKQLGIPWLNKSSAIHPVGLQGHTGLVPASGNKPEQRLAVVYYGYNVFIFKGMPDTSTRVSPSLDQDLLSIINSFRPVHPQSIGRGDTKTIHYVKATENTTFGRLAKHFKLGSQGENDLRIINNFYPAGEPNAGQWIKVIR